MHRTLFQSTLPTRSPARKLAAARSGCRFVFQLPLLLALLLGGVGLVNFSAHAASANEERALKSARRSFKDGWYEMAVRELGDFVRDYPQSEAVPEAVLLQGQALCQSGSPERTVELLTGRLGGAGRLAGQYRYWLGEASLQRADYGGAARWFGEALRQPPVTANVLESSYGEALARFRLGDLARTVELLGGPTNQFEAAAQTRPTEEIAMRGGLLLAEALLLQSQYLAAEARLAELLARALKPAYRWQAQYLQVRSLLGRGETMPAQAAATNLLAIASETGSRTNFAEAVAFNGEILRQLSQPEAAIQMLTNNLAETIPLEYRRQALLKLVEVNLGRNQLAPAVEWLETFRKLHPQDPALDVVVLTLGELKLKQFYATAPGGEPAGTNLLAQARALSQQVIDGFPQSAWLGQAWLNLGWCGWEEGNYPASEAAFKAATERLPVSREQALARFKWADAQFAQTNFPAALANYRQVVDGSARTDWARSGFVEQALFQVVQTAVEVGDPGAADEALEKILEWFPDSPYRDQGNLLAAQGFNRMRQPAVARARFEKFANAFTNSPYLGQAWLAIAQTYVLETDWTNALARYDEWVTRFPTNLAALPQVEFDRAWVYAQAGRETNALPLFTNFVARFPTNVNAPLAQQWVGDYYLNHGDYPAAELNYQLLFQNTNWPASRLAFEARLMAGRAALARQGYADARGYFTNLINDVRCPTNLLPAAYYALGDTYLEQDPEPGATNTLDRFAKAIPVFDAIRKNYPSSSLVPLALGKIANCHLQLGLEDPARYLAAATNYLEVMSLPAADVATRSQAEIGLAIVREKQGEQLKTAAEKSVLLKEALEHCLTVFYQRNLRPGEAADSFWRSQGGLEAARLAESFQLWSQAANLYQSLMDSYPPLQSTLTNKLARARDRAGAN